MGLPAYLENLQKARNVNRVTDNSPLLRIYADSAHNDKIALGRRFNKRMSIEPLDTTPERKNYMKSSIDLSYLDTIDKVEI